jgi:hypothetical protein
MPISFWTDSCRRIAVRPDFGLGDGWKARMMHDRGQGFNFFLPFSPFFGYLTSIPFEIKHKIEGFDRFELRIENVFLG